MIITYLERRPVLVSSCSSNQAYLDSDNQKCSTNFKCYMINSDNDSSSSNDNCDDEDTI